MNFPSSYDEWLAVWTAIEPVISAITGIAGLLALLCGAWMFLRWKVVPFTIFGYHVSMIDSLMRQTDDVIHFDDLLGDRPGRMRSWEGPRVS